MQIQERDFNLIVFLIILGTGVGILLCWAIFRFFSPAEHNPHSMSPEQAVYMREVRMRNLRGLATMMGRRDILWELDGRSHEDIGH